LQGTATFPWLSATCSKTFRRAAWRADAPKTLVRGFKSAGNATSPSATAEHGMGTTPLVGIIQQNICGESRTIGANIYLQDRIMYNHSQ